MADNLSHQQQQKVLKIGGKQRINHNTSSLSVRVLKCKSWRKNGTLGSSRMLQEFVESKVYKAK